MIPPTKDSPIVIEVDEGNFQRDVIQRSRELPIVVDFWAVWCGPCRMLGPILEELAREYAGRFILAKLNVDENPALAAQYNIQGIPAVKAFRDGKVAAEFVGALPRPAVRQFVEKLLPNGVEVAVAAAHALLQAGKAGEAEVRLRAALADSPDHPAVLVGLAEAELAQGREAEALAILDRLPTAEASRLRMAIALRQAARDTSEAGLRACLAADPGDLPARFALGSLLSLQNRYEEALEQFLENVRRDRGVERNRAREAMLHLFDILGDDPLARTFRNRLASLLFA